MENENYVGGAMWNKGNYSSPFVGTPWNSDQEIYNYAVHRRYELGWDWIDVKNDLTSNGLNERYADAIIQNLIQAYGYAGSSTATGGVVPIVDNRGMFRRPFSFEGRIRRTEYCLSVLLYYAAIYGAAFFIDLFAFVGDRDLSMILFFLFFIATYWFLIAQGCKRCHDLGHSGWWQLIPFYMLWMMFAPGDKGTTGYGTSPKA